MHGDFIFISRDSAFTLISYIDYKMLFVVFIPYSHPLYANFFL